jgi:MATE family multidrug resistance protein
MVTPLPKEKYRDVLRVSLPLVAAMASATVMQFTDRIFLSNYSLDAIAAALPAGIAAHFFITMFDGTAGYLNVFIAQYTGAAAMNRVGAALWQGIYFSLAAALVMIGLASLAEPIFRLAGHAAEIQRLEIIYFRVMCFGAGFHVLSTTLACFYSGRGRTRPVMVINLFGMLVNIPLDYALINGWGIFPELGILGAALATVFSWFLTSAVFALLIFTRENDLTFGVLKQRAMDTQLLRRLMRFGIPGALQFTADIFTFMFFIFIVGRIGKMELAVTNIVMSIDTLSFFPLMGISLGTSTLVGQALGRDKPQDAVAATRATLHLTLIYTVSLMALFVLVPKPLLNLFWPEGLDPDQYAKINTVGVVLLRYVAGFLFFDAVYMIYTGTLKGAGDTRFVLISIVSVSVLAMVLPTYIGVVHFGLGLYYAWACAVLFIFVLAVVVALRYRQGKWKKMRVIEGFPV